METCRLRSETIARHRVGRAVHHRARVLELHLAVGEHVLHRLEGADGLAELLALLGVLGSQADQRVGGAEQLRAQAARAPRSSAAAQSLRPALAVGDTRGVAGSKSTLKSRRDGSLAGCATISRPPAPPRAPRRRAASSSRCATSASTTSGETSWATATIASPPPMRGSQRRPARRRRARRAAAPPRPPSRPPARAAPRVRPPRRAAPSRSRSCPCRRGPRARAAPARRARRAVAQSAGRVAALPRPTPCGSPRACTRSRGSRARRLEQELVFVEGEVARLLPRQAEDALGDDVALDLVGARVDGTGQREDVAVEPLADTPRPPEACGSSSARQPRISSATSCISTSSSDQKILLSDASAPILPPSSSRETVR